MNQRYVLEQSPDTQKSLKAQERRNSCKVSSQETKGGGPSAGTIGWVESKGDFGRDSGGEVIKA